MTEQEYVVEQFQKAFETMGDCPLVLYGLGKNTEAVLSATKGFHFAGLMDSKNEGQTQWGLKVLSEEDVIKLCPVIVIIARQSVVPIIYERIAHLQREKGIPIYDFKGELLGQKEWEYANSNLPYWKVTKQDMMCGIDSHEVISFDIFDTLLMRRTLVPGDVFHIVERILKEQTGEGHEFAKRRVEAEHSIEGCPTIDEIYDAMGRMYQVSEILLTEWKKIEWDVENQVLVPRKEMVEVFRYALEAKKQVYLISDMYYSAKQLQTLLVKAGIQGYEKLFVSCEYGVSKESGGLYETYKQMVGATSYLHIGDNRRADGEMAQSQGIDSFLIYSGYEMWMASSMQTLLSHVTTLEQKCILGNLVWKCCENPFALNETLGMFFVEEPEFLGYVFLGALYDEFAYWLVEHLTDSGIEQLLLPSRDGYFIEKLLGGFSQKPFDTVYFKASRRAVSVAAIQNEEDIQQLKNRVFQGTHEELMKKRFGVEVLTGVDERTLIFHRAEKERKAYLNYLRDLKLVNGKKQGVFDFVASGSVQFYLQKLLQKDLIGFYFATMNHPKPEYHLDGQIHSAYGNITSYRTENYVGKYYLFLETIMVDGFPTFQCMEDGHFIYEKENCSDFKVIQTVQDGILQYQKDMQMMRNMVPNWNLETEFADEIFGRLFSGCCSVNQELKSSFLNDDSLDGVSTYQVWKAEP